MSVFISNVRKRLLKRNKNWLCIVCGETGSGKSYIALGLGELIAKERFGIDNVVFTAEQFLSLLNSKKLKGGDVVVWDEAGVGLSSQEWYSLSNKLINYVLQTFRYENLAVIFTTPSFDFIDSKTRKLFHVYIETIGINHTKKLCFAKCLNIQYNARTGTPYFKYSRVLEDGRSMRVVRNIFHLPSAGLISAYEHKKQCFAKTLKMDVELELKTQKLKGDMSKPVDLNAVIREVKKTSGRYIKEYAGKRFIDQHLLMSDFGLGKGRAKTVKHAVEKEIGLQGKIGPVVI